MSLNQSDDSETPSIGTRFFDELEGATMTIIDKGDGDYEGWAIASDGSDLRFALLASLSRTHPLRS